MHVYWYGLSVFKYNYRHIVYAFEFNTASLSYVAIGGDVLFDFSQKLCQIMSALFLEEMDSKEK